MFSLTGVKTIASLTKNIANAFIILKYTFLLVNPEPPINHSDKLDSN